MRLRRKTSWTIPHGQQAFIQGFKGPNTEKPPLPELKAAEAAGTFPLLPSNLPPGPLPESPAHVLPEFQKLETTSHYYNDDNSATVMH